MQQINDKVKSVLGFAVKAGKVIYGVDNINNSKRKKYLIVICSSLKEKAVAQLVYNYSSIPILQTKTDKLGDIICRGNCKVLALTDKQMSEAIIKMFNKDKYHFISEDK